MPDRLLESLIEFALLGGLLLILHVVRRGRADVRWSALAFAAFVLNEVLSVQAYWTIPSLPWFEGSRWVWSGKIYATIGLLLFVWALRSVSFKDVGITLRQAPGGWRWGGGVTLALCVLLTVAATQFPPDGFRGDWEALAFQLTMPGIQEELFYRGVFLVLLIRAAGMSLERPGTAFGWAFLISAVMFGAPHGLSANGGELSFHWMGAAYTFLASLVLGWLWLRTRSLLMPVFIHNYGNSIFYLV